MAKIASLNKKKLNGKLVKNYIININNEKIRKRGQIIKQLEAINKTLSLIPSTRETLIDFFQRTTIPGLNSLGYSFNFYYKSAWVVLFLSCLTMGIYQSSNLLGQYQKHPIIEAVNKEIYSKVQFPAVSVCLNSPIRWINSTDEPMQTVLKNTMEEFAAKEHPVYTSMSNDGYDHREMKLLEEMSKCSKEDRVKLGYPIRSFVIRCFWEGEDCTSNLYLFNNLHFGSCFTFNPGFNNDILYAGKSKSLMMLVRGDFPDFFPFTLRDDVTFLSLHAPGSAPILDRRRMHSLFPGRWMKIGITETSEISRLPEPYPSKCVDEKLEKIRRKSYYYGHKWPYYYSVEACTETCLQNATIHACHCFIPIYPLPFGHPNKICHKDECMVTGDDLSCDCPKPCNELQHQFQITIDDRWLTQDIWIEWVRAMLTAENNMSLDVKRVSGFEVYVSSTLHTLVQEEQKISWADFLGSIGGNISLWIGLSIISVAEILDIIIKLIVISLKNVLQKTINRYYSSLSKTYIDR